MDKVYCPWCNSEMVKSGFGVADWFCCVKCKATSPREIGIEDAYAAAMRRPLQKPLTLEEACGSEEPCVYVEFKGSEYIKAGDCVLSPCAKYIVDITMIGINAVGHFKDADYGRVWRCWATKPTQEEREEAKWKA